MDGSKPTDQNSKHIRQNSLKVDKHYKKSKKSQPDRKKTFGSFKPNKIVFFFFKLNVIC